MNTQEENEQIEPAPELMIPWSIVIFKEGDQWMAMGLERLTFWWADTIEEAFTGLIKAMYWQVHMDRGCGQVPFSLVPRAKERYWNFYRSAVKSTELQMPLPLTGEVRVLV